MTKDQATRYAAVMAGMSAPPSTAKAISTYRQAIVTRYAGPTNHRGSRIIVTSQAGRMTVPWDHALNADRNHAAACEAYAAKQGWDGMWSGAVLPDGRGYAWVTYYGEPVS